MINESSSLLGQPSTTGYARFQLIFKGRLNEAEAIAVRKRDFDDLLFTALCSMCFNSHHSSTPKRCILQRVTLSVILSFCETRILIKFPFDQKRLGFLAVYRLFQGARSSIQTLFILMPDARALFKGFKQSAKSST